MRANRGSGCFFLAALAFTDLQPAAREVLQTLGVSRESFAAFLTAINATTAERERAGEGDHLIYYVLQSRQFTGAAPIEPAVSARDFHQTGLISAAATRRFDDFLKARAAGERMIYLRGMIPRDGALEYLKTEYARAMLSLYTKEFENSPQFYQTRGHSTDTQIPANYAVWVALSALHAEHPELTLNRVLVIGPGVDFAPRTSLDDRYPPQSFQPYAIADALLSTGLSKRPAIHCIDINGRVVAFFNNFPKRNPAILHLVSPPGDADYLDYFAHLGTAIGTINARGSFAKDVRLRNDVLEFVTAEHGNIITEHPPGAAGSYDLVVATNVLLYFNDAELLLAVSNISAALKPGAYLLHNDTRPQAETFARAAGLIPVESRTVRVASGMKSPLYDAFNILRKGPISLDIPSRNQ